MAPLCFTDHAQPQDMWLVLRLRQRRVSLLLLPISGDWGHAHCAAVFKLGLSLDGWYYQSQVGRERWLACTDKTTQPVGLRTAPCGWTICAQQLRGDVVHLVPACLFEGWNMHMVPQGRGRSGSSFGKVAASRPIPFAWWWRKLVPDG